MLRNFSQPFQYRCLLLVHWGLIPLVNRLVDNGCFFFFVEFEQAFFVGNEFVYFCCFSVEIAGYSSLFLGSWERVCKLNKNILIQMLNCRTI